MRPNVSIHPILNQCFVCGAFWLFYCTAVHNHQRPSSFVPATKASWPYRWCCRCRWCWLPRGLYNVLVGIATHKGLCMVAERGLTTRSD